MASKFTLNDQKIRVNILDADTNQIIQRNILTDSHAGFPGGPLVGIFHNGTADITIPYVGGDREGTYTIDFVQSQIASLGYDYSSITGNIFKSSYDSEVDLYLFPWVVNIYMRKL
ncbi:MAG TPA: hypothetical protein DIT04_06125 [Dysgonomonas sp.]|nr:hypothetical protein [Dysgonomonas sp.]